MPRPNLPPRYYLIVESDVINFKVMHLASPCIHPQLTVALIFASFYALCERKYTIIVGEHAATLSSPPTREACQSGCGGLRGP